MEQKPAGGLLKEEQMFAQEPSKQIGLKHQHVHQLATG